MKRSDLKPDFPADARCLLDVGEIPPNLRGVAEVILEIDKVVKRFDSFTAVDGVSL